MYLRLFVGLDWGLWVGIVAVKVDVGYHFLSEEELVEMIIVQEAHRVSGSSADHGFWGFCDLAAGVVAIRQVFQELVRFDRRDIGQVGPSMDHGTLLETNL
jgi:hypothetical protein